MATRFVFTPFSAEFPATNFPGITAVNRRPVLGFDTTTAETCYWTAAAPQGLTGTISCVIYYITTATTGTVAFTAALEAVTDGDATDLDSTTSFDTGNSNSPVTVPGTAGYIDMISITMTNADSIAAGDYFRLSIVRDVANDTAAADAQILTVEIRDGA